VCIYILLVSTKDQLDYPNSGGLLISLHPSKF
jgi:hypothetical protein